MSRPSTAIARGPTGFPDRIILKLSYFDSFNFSLTAGVGGAEVIRGNSCYDPDRTLTGHQPYGYDQWAAFYQRYRVLGSAIRCVPTAGSTDFTGSSNVSCRLTVVPQIAGGATSGNEILEQPYSRSRNVTYYNNAQGIIKHYMSTAKMWGARKSAVHDEYDYSATTNANPANSWDWLIYVTPGSNGTGTSYWAVDVKVTYYVEFSERLQLNSS